MARLRLYVKVERRWWFYPYHYAVLMFLWSVAPFLEVDDPRLDAFITRQVNFLIDRGLRIVPTTHDPGELN